MTTAILEHINVTVTDAKATANQMCDLFDWKIRWEGSAMNGAGHTCHVGDDDFYLAVYSPVKEARPPEKSGYNQANILNHVGLVVNDIDAMEARVIDAGYKPHSHDDYEPGRRFYFDGPDDIEFEIVSYN